MFIYELLFGHPPFSSPNSYELQEMIVEAKYTLPKEAGKYTCDIISSFLQPDASIRLGCFKFGIEDIKRHKWFSKTNWDEVSGRKQEGPLKCG